MTPEQLKSIRSKLGLTQAELAEKLGVTWNTVARWEIGARKVPEMAVKLLKTIRPKK